MARTIPIRTALLAPLLAAAVPTAEARAPHAAAAAVSETARLEALKAAAAKLDQATDPRAYRTAWLAVVEQARKVYPAGHPEIETLMMEVHTANFLLGENAGILPAIQRSVAIYEAAGPDYRDELVAALNNMAVLADAVGQPDIGVPALERAIAIWKADAPVGGTKDLGIAIGNLAWAHRGLGHYAQALPIALEGLAMLEGLHKADPKNSQIADALTIALSNQTIHLKDLGRGGEAADAVRALVARLDELVGPDSPSAANALVNGSIYVVDDGRFDEAEAMIRRAVAIREKSLGVDAPRTAEARLTQVSILMTAGRYEEAQPIAEYVYETLRRGLGEEAQPTVEARGKIARIAYARGDVARGIAETEGLVTMLAAKLPAGHRDVVDYREFLGTMYARQGRWADAETALLAAVEGRKGSATANGPAAMASQALLAMAEARNGKQAEARTRLDRVVPRLFELLGQEVASEGSRGNRSIVLNRSIGWASLAAADSGDVARSFDLAQFFRLGASDRAVLRARGRDLAASPQAAERLRLQQDLIEQRSRQQQAMDRAAAAGDIPAVQAAKADADSLTLRIAALAQDGAASAFDAIHLADLQASLAADEAVFLSLETEMGTRLFAVSRKAVASAPAGLSTQAIAALVKAVRAQIEQGLADDTPFNPANTDALHAALFTPEVEKVLNGKRQVHVLAKGELSRLPFAVLTRPRGRSGHEWAIERHAFSYPVGLASLNSRSRQGGAFASFVGIGAPALPDLAAADPASGNGGSGSGTARLRAFRGAANGRKIVGLGALGMAEAELTGMASAMAARQTTVLAGAQATEAGLRGVDLAQADVITFATHGLMAGELEGLSEAALVLSPPQGSAAEAADDGLLTTTEIAALHLKARLVVLSACNSGAGARSGDDALSGLAHAFLYAGAHRLMVSHWRVRDDAAARLTVATARGQAAGLDPAEALRRAQISLLHDAKVPGAAHPAIWAPFVLVGN